MKKFSIVYCFTDMLGNVELNELEEEQYYTEEIVALNEMDAIELFLKKEKFLQEPEIVEVFEI